MPTNLTNLPQEIRDKFWNQLLLDGTDNRLKQRKISTQLFRVNKAISAETLAFFYRENAFILIEAIGIGIRSFLTDLLEPATLTRAAMEMNFISNMKFLPKVALRINLIQGYNKAAVGGEDVWEFDQVKPSISRVLMPARHLPRLIQTINCVRSPLFYLEDEMARPICKIQLDFKPAEECYRDDGVTRRLVRGLKGLRQFHVFGRCAYQRRLGGVFLQHANINMDQPAFKTELEITGLDNTLTEELLKSTNLPGWTIESAIAEAKQLVQQARTHEVRGDYAAAYLDLSMSQLLLGYQKLAGLTKAPLSQPTHFEMISILFDIALASDELAWKLRSEYRTYLLGDTDFDACGRIMTMLDGILSELTLKENSDGEGGLDDATREDLKTGKSNLILKYCRYMLYSGLVSRAITSIDLGLEWNPNNKGLQNMKLEIDKKYDHSPAAAEAARKEAIKGMREREKIIKELHNEYGGDRDTMFFLFPLGLYPVGGNPNLVDIMNLSI